MTTNREIAEDKLAIWVDSDMKRTCINLLTTAYDTADARVLAAREAGIREADRALIRLHNDGPMTSMWNSALLRAADAILAILTSPAVDPRQAVVDGWTEDWEALYVAIGLPKETTDSKVIVSRVMEMRAALELVIGMASYLFETDCSDYDQYQWLKAECIRRLPSFFTADGKAVRAYTGDQS